MSFPPQRRRPIIQLVFDDTSQTGERHIVHGDIDRGAVVLDRFDVAAAFA